MVLSAASGPGHVTVRKRWKGFLVRALFIRKGARQVTLCTSTVLMMISLLALPVLLSYEVGTIGSSNQFVYHVGIVNKIILPLLTGTLSFLRLSQDKQGVRNQWNHLGYWN